MRFGGRSNAASRKKEYRGVAQLGSALGSGPRGRWFESSHSDHLCSTKRLQPQKAPIFGAFSVFSRAFGAFTQVFD